MGWKSAFKKAKKQVTRPFRTVKKLVGSGSRDGDARSEAALQKVTGPTTKQAGSGSITYNEDRYE